MYTMFETFSVELDDKPTSSPELVTDLQVLDTLLSFHQGLRSKSQVSSNEQTLENKSHSLKILLTVFR